MGAQKKIIKVVLDTNVFVSGLLFGGLPAKLITLFQEGKFIPLLSKEILEEYISVLSYPKFQLNKNIIKEIIELELLPFVEIVCLKNKVALITEDPSDDKFLECGIDGNADYIISGDSHLLKVGNYKNVSIIKARTFLDGF